MRCKSLDRNESEAESSGGMMEAFELLFLLVFFFFTKDLWVERLLEFEEVPDNASEFVGHGGDGFGGAEFGFPASV